MGTQTDYFKVPRKWKEFHVHRTASEKLHQSLHQTNGLMKFITNQQIWLQDIGSALQEKGSSPRSEGLWRSGRVEATITDPARGMIVTVRGLDNDSTCAVHVKLILLKCRCCWCADAADAMLLLLHCCCWCTVAADALMLLMRWCCCCADATEVLMLLMHCCC